MKGREMKNILSGHDYPNVCVIFLLVFMFVDIESQGVDS